MGRQVRRSAVRAVAMMALVGALVSGCGTGPSQVGAAVIVGDEVVSTDEIQVRLDAVLARKDLIEPLMAQGITIADIARNVASEAVQHELAVRAAREFGIVVTDADIDVELGQPSEQQARLEALLGGRDALRQYIGDMIIRERLAAQQVNGLAVTVDYIGLGSRIEARDAAGVLAGGGAAAEQLFADNPELVERGTEYRAASSPDEAASPLFGTPEGGVGWFQPIPDQELWLVYRVLDRRLDAPPVPAELDLVPQIGKDGLAEIGRRLLQPIAAEVEVRVNPRYGVWDPVSLSVLPEEGLAGGLVEQRS